MDKILKQFSILIIIIACAACGEKEEAKKPETRTEATIRTTFVQQRHISGDVQLPGVLQPNEFVALHPKISGFVKSVSVDRGTVVRRGQLLIQLEAPEIEQQVAAAKLKYGQAEAQYITSKDRYRRLLETSHTPGTISPYDLEAAEAKMRGDSATAQGEYANYRAQESMKSYLIVRAPFDGVITERNVHPGALVGPGSQNAKPMLVLQQLSDLRLVVDVPEQYTSQIRKGDKVHYKINAIPGQEFTGEIARSSQSLSNSYRSETIEIDVKNRGNLLKPGMYAEVILPTGGNANAYVVPKSCVVTTTERKYVVAVQNNTAKWVDISEGNQKGDSTEIFGNVHDGDEVVVNASYQVKDGQRIK